MIDVNVVFPSASEYRSILCIKYPTMPSGRVDDYVKEYILMEGPGFPLISDSDKIKYSNPNEIN